MSLRAAKGTLLLGILAAILLSACGARPISLSGGPRAFTANDYESIYDAWTREIDEFAFGRLSSVLHATVTMQSKEFRWAYVVRYAADYSLSTETRTEMLSASLADADANHRFFLTFVGQNFRESDLTSDRSAWRVMLVDGAGRTTAPTAIERIGQPSAAERTYFPSVSPQRHAFRLVFPIVDANGLPVIPEDAREVRMRFAGPGGNVDLVWTLAR